MEEGLCPCFTGREMDAPCPKHTVARGQDDPRARVSWLPGLVSLSRRPQCTGASRTGLGSGISIPCLYLLPRVPHHLPPEREVPAPAPVIGGSQSTHCDPHNPEVCDWQGGGLGGGEGEGNAGEIYFLSNLRCPRQKEGLLQMALGSVPGT